MYVVFRCNLWVDNARLAIRSGDALRISSSDILNKSLERSHMAIYIANDRQEGRSAQNKSKSKRDFVLGVQVQGVYVYEVVLLLWSRSPQSGGLSRQDVGPPPPGMEE